MVFGYVCLAHGSIAFMCAGHLPVVHVVAAAVPTVDLKSTDPDLDIEHYSYVLCLAFADTRTAVDGSGLDYGVGIRIRGSSCCNPRFAPRQPIGHPSRAQGTG